MNQRDLAIELFNVRDQISKLKDQESEIERTLAEEMDMDALIVEGYGVFERRMSKDRKAWDSEALVSDIRRKMTEIPRMVHPATGEIESDTEAFARVLKECARMDWRVTALRKFDFQPDEYCETTPGHYKVQLTRTINQKGQ